MQERERWRKGVESYFQVRLALPAAPLTGESSRPLPDCRDLVEVDADKADGDGWAS